MVALSIIDIPDVLETDRLILRAPQRGDGEQHYGALNETSEQLKPWFASWAKRSLPRERAEQWVLEMRELFLQRKELTYFVFDKQHGALIGYVLISNIDWSVPKGKLSYWICTGFQFSDLAAEFVKCINALCMEKLRFQRLELYINAENQASLCLASKLGYCLEGRMRNYAYDNFGELADYAVYSMTPGDYFEMVAVSCIGEAAAALITQPVQHALIPQPAVRFA